MYYAMFTHLSNRPLLLYLSLQSYKELSTGLQRAIYNSK